MTDTEGLLKTEWPKYIADALGIPPVPGSGGPWHSTGGTTDLAWFEAVCEATGVPYQLNRVATMQALIESVGEVWDPAVMSSELTVSGGGGNIKVEAFRAFWRGLNASTPGANALVFSETTREMFDDPPAEVDQRDYVLGLIRRRLGQPKFRARLLEDYGGRCAVTGSDVIEILEAAHITSFAAGGPMTTQNGLLLRADIHTLFDLGLIGIDSHSWKVVVHPKLAETDLGKDLAGRELRLPASEDAWPSAARLEEHRQRFLG